MDDNQAGDSRPWKAARRLIGRTLSLGVLGVVAGALVGGLIGTALCLTDGLPWGIAAWWCLRGAFAGLAAGVIMGAASSAYHAEEPAPAARPEKPRPAVVPNGKARPERSAVPERNGVRVPN